MERRGIEPNRPGPLRRTRGGGKEEGTQETSRDRREILPLTGAGGGLVMGGCTGWVEVNLQGGLQVENGPPDG